MPFELGPNARAAGYRLVEYESIGSTSAEALERAALGDAGRLWVVARRQTAGHGRRGRTWETPVGNLAASLLIVQRERRLNSATLGFVAGLALESAIRFVLTTRGSVHQNPPPLRGRVPLSLAKGAGEGEVYDVAVAVNQGPPPLPVGAADHPLPHTKSGVPDFDANPTSNPETSGLRGERVRPRPELRLKWPNDVLFDGAKVAGILLEAVTVTDTRHSLVIGIGVNVQHAPEGIPYPVTSLFDRGVDVSPEALFIGLADAWVEQERLWNDGRGFAVIRDRWLKRAAGLGAPIAVKSGEDTYRGTFETIDDEGRMIVRTSDGSSRAISAGDVHFGVAATAVN